MIILSIIYLYAAIKGKMMFKREDWTLVQQEITAREDELSETYSLNDTQYKNISIAVQFYRRKEK